MKDYYTILGVEPTADETTIKSAYRKLAKELHPDVNKAADAEAKFKEISEAYDTLKDSGKKAEYDAMRSGMGNGGPRGPNFYWSNRPDVDIDFEELLRNTGGFRHQQWSQPPANRDIVLSYAITLEEAFAGKEADISYNLAGKEPQKVKFKVPAGIQDGMKLRFAGKGDDSLVNAPPGHLYIRINIIPHHRFGRIGPNLVTAIDVDYLDAILGTEVEIATIDGGKIKMRVPAGIFPGQSLRASGKGMPVNNTQRGDMLVELNITPSKLTEEQRALIQQAKDLKNT
jgi:curved DNA-binding protein